jgi:hypothetical protein
MALGRYLRRIGATLAGYRRSIEYVPIKHDRIKVLDCPVALPGLTP